MIKLHWNNYQREERTFKLDAELTSTNQYLGSFNTNYIVFRNV
jgi:hypothetical protein